MCLIKDILFLKLVKLFRQIFGPVFEYRNTLRGAKKMNTEYQILFSIEIIRIPNTNTTVWSNYSNSI